MLIHGRATASRPDGLHIRREHVGLFAIQIAKARGIKVVASASGRNEELVKKMGADEFIDYTKEPIHKYLNSHPPETKFDAIIDA
ncbi:hypothetical protein PTI98_002615 [Pleurotus ostreatus]|nr:hypothetical protein PTI98_002615 [Pleurotus ostreatus]